jgi:hypothetical protein
MAITITTPGMPSARTTTLDLELFQADQTLLSKNTDSTKDGARTIVFDYNAGVGLNSKRQVRHTTTTTANTRRTEISLSGAYVRSDSVSGVDTPSALRTWGIYTIQPLTVFELTPAHLQVDLEFVFSLFFPSVSSGAASDAFIKKLMTGSRWLPE